MFVSCDGQTNNPALNNPRKEPGNAVGGAFENADYMYQGMPNHIIAVDTSPGWGQKGQKLFITGTIYKRDGKTPAPDVLLYYYHTNVEGRYVHKPGEKRTMPPNHLGQTHGYIRGWIKTNKAGRYSLYTVRPGVYPTRDEPAHIHLSIKEPGLEHTYYIDEFVFDDDKLLTSAKRKKLENRGGSGVLRLLQKDNLHVAEHAIILGLNIPNYPDSNKSGRQSGRQVGEDQPSFTPFHAFGPDKGTKTCPVCKYGRYHGVIYFVGNKPNWDETERWLTFLERQSVSRSKYLKVYFVYGNTQNYEKAMRQRELEKIGAKLNLKQIALTFVPSFDDNASEVNLNKINPTVENTFVVFKHSRIIDKFVDLKPTAENFDLLATILDSTKGDFFYLEGLTHE